MKICIVTYDEYINIPYVQTYEDILKAKGIAYDIVLWNRSGQGGDTPPGAAQSFVFVQTTKASKLSKVLPFLRWRRFVKSILRRGRYDGLILCTTMPGVLLSDVLTKGYPGKYLLDIRDYTYENQPLYRRISQNNLRAAGLVCISSEGFLRWLPPDLGYTVTHNLSNTAMAVESAPSFETQTTRTIGFVGGLRYYDVNKRLIDHFGNNGRYRLFYAGKQHPGCDLAAYCEGHGIGNVDFLPRFHNAQKPELYKQIDLINSVYGADSEETRSLLPHRLYDCALFKKPILVSKGTYLEEVVQRYGLGCAIDHRSEDIASRIESYIATFDPAAFLAGCAAFLQTALRDEALCRERMDVFFDSLSPRVSP